MGVVEILVPGRDGTVAATVVGEAVMPLMVFPKKGAYCFLLGRACWMVKSILLLVLMF